MKPLLLSLAVLSLIFPNLSQASNKPCSLTLKLKTPNAKSAHLNGVSFSAKHLEALKSVCEVIVVPLSKEEKIQQFIDKLEANEKGGK